MCYICWFTIFLQWLKSYVLLAILYVTHLRNLQLKFFFYLQCVCMCLALNSCCYPVLYGFVTVYVLRASNYTWGPQGVESLRRPLVLLWWCSCISAC